MPVTQKSLSELSAADLMSRELVAVPHELSMRAAAQMLTKAQVSGAPVVDAQGRCVGVLSATDFFRKAAGGNLEELPADAVGVHMTPDPVTVAAATPVRTLARMMLDAHIHRVIVVDEQRKPIGIVSSTDILAAMAYGGE